MKNLNYETHVQSEMDLVAKAAVAAIGDIALDWRMLSLYIEVDHSHFEQSLLT